MSKFFNQFNRMVMLGVGGTGMRGLANLLQNTNNNIVGTDININQIKTDPNLHNIQLVSQSNIVDDLKSADLVIITDAISDDDPIRQAAFKRGTTILTYHEAIGHFAQDYQTIAVTGAHGKSSTTAFLAKIMIDAGLDPTVLIGAGVPEWGNTNSRQGKSRWFLIEADEYKRHFLSLSPMHIIVTNIDFDHPDYFKSLADVKKAMRDFLHSVHPAGHIISSQQVIKNYIEIFPTRNTIAITFNNEKLPLTTPGIHMQQNAQLAIALAKQLGVSRGLAKQSVSSFLGLTRRFELLGNIGSLKIISDYGHHPAEINITMQGARQIYKNQKSLLIFEPHTYMRLNTFYNDFMKILTTQADGILICPVFKARSESTARQRSHYDIYSDLKKNGVMVEIINSFAELKSVLERLESKYDFAIAFTAGELDYHLRSLMLPSRRQIVD